ncbi:MAG: hypothetical protein M1834_005381 [Cirrosporium novae-zelandiae]|nr:MAG: hypothetical protein M1834_005381 [Cirrosporium novae-zelandiae]
MIYLPPLRRFLLPSLILLAIILIRRLHVNYLIALTSFRPYNTANHVEGIRIPYKDWKQHSLPIRDPSENHLSPPNHYFYTYDEDDLLGGDNASSTTAIWSKPALNPAMGMLFQCYASPNKYTNAIRLPNILRNISMTVPGSLQKDNRIFWNPTIISLPYWSENQYLLVSRIITDGFYQENVLCEANICYNSREYKRDGELPCTEDDIEYLGGAGGLRCVTEPIPLRVPPTPAEHCEGRHQFFSEIPGFHDPRIFWSGKGEPLMMVNTQSRYACFGLWLIDLRTLHPPLARLLSSDPTFPSLGPLMSYPTLTELTRNPASTRHNIEKNWCLFFSGSQSHIQYEVSPQVRTFAKLIGNGFTTPNLTDPLERPCLQQNDTHDDDESRGGGEGGTWHQATNSLQLVLCNRHDPRCKPSRNNTVFFAVVHRKFGNVLGLPMRYERYFIVWLATPPFSMLGVSRYPILFRNETLSGWSAEENWDDDNSNNNHPQPPHLHSQIQTPNNSNMPNRPIPTYKNTTTHSHSHPQPQPPLWSPFTYTVSISWAFGRPHDSPQTKNSGYLDDNVVVSIGVEDEGQVVGIARAAELLVCLRGCLGRR